jgi:hypothetical protein
MYLLKVKALVFYLVDIYYKIQNPLEISIRGRDLEEEVRN